MSCFLFLWVLSIWKLLPGPGARPGLGGVSSSETGPGCRTVDWPACFLPLLQQGLKALLLSPTPSPPTCQKGNSATSPSFSEQLGHHPHIEWLHDLSPRASAPTTTPSASTARRATGSLITRELSDTEALSSPNIAAQPSHQQVFHHQVQGHRCQ